MKLVLLLFACANALKLYKDSPEKPTIAQYVKHSLIAAKEIITQLEGKLSKGGKKRSALKEVETADVTSQTDTFDSLVNSFTEGKLHSRPPAKFFNTTIELSAEELAEVNHPVQGGGGGWHFQSFNPIGVWAWSGGAGCFLETGCEPGFTQYLRTATSAVVPWFAPTCTTESECEEEIAAFTPTFRLRASKHAPSAAGINQAGSSTTRVQIPCTFNCLPSLPSLFAQIVNLDGPTKKDLKTKICNNVHLMARGFDDNGKPKTVKVSGNVLAVRPHVNKGCISALRNGAVGLIPRGAGKKKFKNKSKQKSDLKEKEVSMTELERFDQQNAQWFTQRFGAESPNCEDPTTDAVYPKKGASQSIVGIDPNLSLLNEMLVMIYNFGMECDDLFATFQLSPAAMVLAPAKAAMFLFSGGITVVEVTSNEVLLKNNACGISLSAQVSGEMSFMKPMGPKFTLGVAFNGLKSSGPLQVTCPAHDVLKFFVDMGNAVSDAVGFVM